MAAIVLAVLGLAGVLANDLAAIATIVIGGVLLVDGRLASHAFRQLASRSGMARHNSEVVGPMNAEFFGGVAGIVLGILALFHSMPQYLLAVAVIVFGAGLLLGGGLASHLQGLAQAHDQEAGPVVPQEAAVPMESSGSTLVGLAAIVLGILAITGIVPMTLILAALLSLGACALFNGPSFLQRGRAS